MQRRFRMGIVAEMMPCCPKVLSVSDDPLCITGYPLKFDGVFSRVIPTLLGRVGTFRVGYGGTSTRLIIEL